MPTEIDVENLIERFPDVRLDHTNKYFYQGMLDGELRLSRCRGCGWWHHTPKPICPRCWSKDLVATPVAGTGTIHLLILLHQGPPAEGVDYVTPHPVATVELDEQKGLRFTSAVLDDPGSLSIGDRVRLEWITRQGRPVPAWRRAGGEVGAS